MSARTGHRLRGSLGVERLEAGLPCMYRIACHASGREIMGKIAFRTCSSYAWRFHTLDIALDIQLPHYTERSRGATCVVQLSLPPTPSLQHDVRCQVSSVTRVDMDAVMLASTPSSMDIIGTMGQQQALSDVPEEMPPPYGTQNTDPWLVRDTTGELLIALESLPKYQALIATVNEALAESTNAASLLQIATRRMFVVRRAARALEAQLAEERALAAVKLQLAARLRAESKAEAAREAEQHVEGAVRSFPVHGRCHSSLLRPPLGLTIG